MSFISKLRLLKNYAGIVWEDLQKRITSHEKIREKKVVFDLKDVRLSAYYFHLIHAFHLAGYQIHIRHHLDFLANCIKSDRFIFHFDSVTLSFFKNNYVHDNWTYIYDRFVNPIEYNWKKRILISCDVYSPKPLHKNWIQVPFSMAPHNYIDDKFRKVYGMRKNKRRIRLFFSGNLDRESYTTPIFRDFFGIMNRVEIINTAKDNLRPYELLEHLPSENAGPNKAVLLCWSWNKGASEDLGKRIPNDQWFNVLSICDFFLATPGIMMPMCFNAIEAMSVGVIPLIEFPELFCPPLKHNENAIVFKGKSDLANKTRTIMEMAPADIKRMRKNVMKYYDNHLYPAIIPDLVECKIGSKGLMFVHATKSSYDDHIQIVNGNLTIAI
jgi:hypothetical protein